MSLPNPPSFSLAGKRALVTGASSGIGLGCAVALADAGAHTVLAARSPQKLDACVSELRARGQQVESLVLDVADIAHMQAEIERSGPYDILINSAGLARHGPALATASDDFDAVVDVNLKGAYFLSQAVARGLVAAGRGGSLINISSQMAHVGGPDRAVYCATKHAVEGFTKAMAIEWGQHGIRINTICPTFIRTPLTEQTFDDPEKVSWLLEKIKLGRVGTVEDIMGAAVYLASDAASLITGTSLKIDGGWTAE
ncbi:SDR family NAD(P)-dependent oxidoreductase [Halomonas huangheensis]|uniref:Ketoreductase domain-containing protein n=1 Tax=Halomonas huangheensis TaxID=1178482 RepID=W1N5N8_9GAMM|nr:SDR family oxidoreductase [Halomonas huangheensis]ALM54328.1 3-oxoacyl-ACP reductase [Halomonas huangheensis]ERL50887.1 hypothetical protein BJB45_20020 [Halomonas huangheensis]